ncbi:ZIP family metal transporter [Candidatus Kaiserbacteria bacterium]|nr:ZIP family metal transporter [Candidatus Kaiserbacteria bacterium]
MVILITVATFFSTLIGGLFALRLRDQLHMILGFSAGAVIGVAFFDLLPEALELAGDTYTAGTILAITVIGFATYLVLDRMVLLHGHGAHHEGHSHRGVAGAGSLSFHSFLDGMGIGLAFQVSVGVGAVVAAAVLAHDFSDGINTVNMVLKNGGKKNEAFRWLLIDSIAPTLGLLSTFLFAVPARELGLLLALFAGFFLYIGASDLIPESYHVHPKRWTTITTVAGMIVLYAVIKLAGL